MYKKIIEVAEETKSDMIMMGTHGVSGAKEFFLGSNTFKVVGKAKCPVLSFQQKAKANGFSDILVPFRDKNHSREGVEYAIQLAKVYGATIHLLGINSDTNKAALKKVQFEAEQAKGIIQSRGAKCTVDVLTSHYTASLILSFAENKKSNMIVMVSDLDKMGLSDYVIGPVAQQLVNHSTIPVLSIRPTYVPSAVKHANPVTN